MVSSVALSWGPVVGIASSVATPAVAVDLRRRDRCDALVGADRRRQGPEDARVPGDVDGDHQGRVDAGSEAVGDEVVGTTLRAVRGEGALVRRTDLKREHRGGHGEQRDGGPDGVRRGVPGDMTTPAQPARPWHWLLARGGCAGVRGR